MSAGQVHGAEGSRDDRVVSPFDRDATALEVVRAIDLHGRTALVTGGGAGIGLATVEALAAAGARVLVADVDVARSEAALAALAARRPGLRVGVLPLDLATLDDVRRFASAFLAREPKLDILVANAGIMACPLSYTVDGHERQFAVNFLGHYLLTRALEPALTRAGGARVVVVSSIGHRRSDVHYEDVDYRTRAYDRWEAYGQSKTACALLAVAADLEWRGRGVRCNAVNPGGSATDLHRYLSDDERRAQGWMDAEGKLPARWRTPDKCAATGVWLATDPGLAGVGARYFEECQEALPWRAEEPMTGVRPYATSPENARRLWAFAAGLTGF